MTNTTMTTREFYTNIIEGNITEEVISKASDLLAALDARNEKRKGADTKAKKEAAARRELVLNFLKSGTSALTRDQIAEGTGLEPAKVTGACTALIKEGAIVKEEVKIDKARKMAYSVA